MTENASTVVYVFFRVTSIIHCILVLKNANNFEHHKPFEFFGERITPVSEKTRSTEAEDGKSHCLCST